MSKSLNIGTTPFSLVYGHDIVLPMEITVKSLRVAQQIELSHFDYHSTIMAELDDLDETQMEALNSILLQK